MRFRQNVSVIKRLFARALGGVTVKKGQQCLLTARMMSDMNRSGRRHGTHTIRANNFSICT